MQRKIFNNLLQVMALYLIFCIFPNILFAGMPNLKLPFEGGETWSVTRAYNTESHKDYGYPWFDHRYALDFSEEECDSWNKPILASADGKVLEAYNVDDNGFGKYVVIDHGDGYRTKYSHLNSVGVKVGDNVFQGQEIGKLGNTGNVSGKACKEHQGAHLDFALYKDEKACKPEPMSGYTNFTAGNWYASDNYCNLFFFTFPNHSSQGWQCSSDTEPAQGNDLNTWQVHITGINPGVESPSFSCGLMAKDTVIKFSARVLGNDYSGRALMYLFDERGSWNNEIQIGNVDMSQNYREYTVDLSSVRSDLEIKKFSLELTSGGSGNDEYWTLDWLKICSKATSWDFTDSQMGWTLVNAISDNIFTASWGDAFWQIDPTGNDPQMISPNVEINTSLYDTLEIRLSAQGAGQTETLYVFYDFGQGFSSANQATKPIIRNNGQAVYTFPVPNNGVLQRLRIDPIPSGDETKNDIIFLDYVRFSNSNVSSDAPVQGALIGGPSGTSAGNSSNQPPYIYSNSVSCKSVNDYQPSGITSIFSADTEKACIFTQVRDARTKLVFKWEFYCDGFGTRVIEREMASAPDAGYYFPEVLAYSWIGVIPNNSYTVKIFINDGDGYEKVDELSFSVERMPPKCAPTNIQTEPDLQNKKIALRWNVVEDADSYVIQQLSQCPGFGYFCIHYTSISASCKTNISIGYKYYYRVKAVNSAGESEWSDSIEVDIVPRLEVDSSSNSGDVLIYSWGENGLGIYNRGIVPVEITSFKISDPDIFEFRTYKYPDILHAKPIAANDLPLKVATAETAFSVRFKPKEAKQYNAVLTLLTNAGDFTINLTGTGKDLKFWHTYTGKAEMISINNYLSGQELLKNTGTAGPNLENRDLPQSVEIVEAADDAADNYDRMWIISKDANGKPMLYQYQRFNSLFANWCYWTNEQVGRFDRVVALHYSFSTSELLIAGYQTTEGGRNVYRLLTGKFEGAWERGLFHDDEKFSQSLSKIVSIFGSRNQNGTTYILQEDGIKMRMGDGRWMLLCRPNSFYERTFTCGTYNDGKEEDISDDEIFIGSAKRTILRIDKSGCYPIRYNCGINTTLYNQLNNKCNKENKGISSDEWIASYCANKAAVYESYAQQYDVYAQRYNTTKWIFSYYKYFADYCRQNAESYRQSEMSYRKQIELRKQQILSYQSQMKELENYTAIVESVKVDSNGNIWSLCNGKISFIKDGKVSEDMKITAAHMQSLMPRTPELLLRELERDGTFWSFENAISGKIEGLERKIAIKDNGKLIILWSGEEFF